MKFFEFRWWKLLITIVLAIICFIMSRRLGNACGLNVSCPQPTENMMFAVLVYIFLAYALIISIEGIHRLIKS